MKNPNGYGTIKKLSGKRRRPFAVYITTSREIVDGKAKQVQKPIGYYATRQEAMIALAEYNKNPYDIDKRNITFKQVYDILLETKFNKMKRGAKNSYAIAYKHCSPLYNMRIKEIKTDHMQRLLDDNAHLSESALNNFKKLFNAIFAFSLKNDICEKNYAQHVEINSTYVPAQKDESVTREQVKMFWDNLGWTNESKKNNSRKLYLMDFVLVHLHTGMRPAELFGLKKEDVHLEERFINCRGTKTENAERIVPIHKDIMPLIAKRLENGNSEYLFPNTKGNKLTHSGYEGWFKPMCENFGLNITPHKCRKAFTSYAIASGMNPILVRKIIGHAGGLTEDVYTHLQIEDLVAEIDKFKI